MLGQIIVREDRRREAKWAARHALIVDMLKSYAAPVVLAAFLNPLLQGEGGGVKLGILNYALFLLGLAMMGLAIIFVPAKE